MRVTAAIVLLLGVSAARAQSLTPFESGSHAFRAVLNICKLKPLETVDEALAEPRRSVIILLGDASYCDNRFANRGLVRYIRRGGAILFATDRPYFGEMFSQLEIAVNGAKMIAPMDAPETLYRDRLRECPLLQKPIRQDLASSLDLLGSLRVATNRPSYFNRPGLTEVTPLQKAEDIPPAANALTIRKHRIIAELPTGSRTIDRSPFVAPQDRFLAALADTMGQGRYAVIADHTLFLNVMMLQSDNDNLAFAVRLTRWLTSDGQRQQVFFVDDGKVRTDFSMNIDYVDPPLPHPDVVGPLVDQLFGDLERSNFFNQGIERLVPPRKILRGVLLAATIFASCYLLFKTINNRFRQARGVARLPDRLTDLSVEPDRHVEHAPATIASAAQELARNAIEQWLNGPIDQQSPPHVTASRAWTMRFQSVWDIATGQKLHVRRPAELEQLARDLGNLQLAVDRGDVRLTAGASL